MTKSDDQAKSAKTDAPETLDDQALDAAAGGAAHRIKVKTYLGGALGGEIATAEVESTDVLKAK